LSSPMPDAAAERASVVTVAVVSADRLLRDGVEAILGGKGFAVTLSVASVGDLVRDLQGGNEPPDVLIMVGALPTRETEISGLGAVRDTAPNLRIIVFADQGADPASLRRLISAGVDALLPSDLSAETLVQSIRLVLLGEGFMFAEYVQRLVEHWQPDDTRMPDLTAREIEIIRLMAAGHSNKAIAEGLNLTEPSVKVQIRRLLRKIGAANRTQAAIWAMERGLVRVE
jgi:two-component system nitrate/nitrite response regulator NarL